MLTSSKISLMLILANFLVAKSQGSQNPQTSTFKSIKMSSDSSSASSSESSTLTLKDISTDSSEIISYSRETSTEFDIFFGTEETEATKSSEIPSGDWSSEVEIVSSSSSSPITESILSLHVPRDEISASSDDKGALMDSLHKHFTKRSTEFDIFSGTKEVEEAKSSETLSGDMSSEMDTPSLSPEAFPLVTEAPVEIVTEDPTETSTELDIFSGTEVFEIPKSSEIQSGDMSSEIDIVPSSSAIPTTEAVLFPNISMDKIPDSPEHKRTTALPKLTEAPAKISTEDSHETYTQIDIFSGTEEFEISKSSEIQSDDTSSEIDIVPSPSATPTTESVVFSDVSMDEIPDSPEHKGTTAFPKLTEAPIEIPTEDPTETSTEFDIYSGTKEVEEAKSSEILSGDLSSEMDTPSLSPEAYPLVTEAPVEIVIEDPTETSTQLDIFSGTEEFEIPKSSEIQSGDMSSEIDIVPSSSAIPTTEAVLFPHVSMEEIPDSPEHKRTTALPNLTEAPAKISTEDSPETSTEFDIFSETEEFEIPKSSEIQSGDMSSEIDIVPSSSATPTTEAVLFPDISMDETLDSPEHKRTTALPKLTEAPVKISSEDSPETSTEFDIFSEREEFEIPKSSEIQSGDMSSEIDIVPSSSATPTTEAVLFPHVSMEEIPDSPEHKRTTAFPKLTEAPAKISTEDSPETSTEFDIFSGTEEFEIPKSSEIQSDDMSSEIDIVPSSSAIPTSGFVLFSDVSMDENPDSPEHTRTTALPKLTEAPAKISTEDSPETSTEFDIFSEIEEFGIPKSSEIQSGDMSSEIDIVPSSSATPTTESVFFPDFPMDETSASLYHKGTTESVKPRESSDISTTPASIQNPTTVIPRNNEVFILPSTTSTELVDSSDSVKLPEEQLSDAFNTSKFVSIAVHKESKTSVGVVFGIVLGSTVGAAFLAAVAFLLYRKRKSNLFAHQRFFDEKNEPVHRLENTTDIYNLGFGGTSFFKSAFTDDPVMEKNTKRVGENIQMKTIPTAYTLNKPWRIGLQKTESRFMPRIVSNS